MLKFLHNAVNQTAKKLSALKASDLPVILYGASDCGKIYLDILMKNGIRVNCFCDDNIIKQKNGFCGKKVISREQLILERGTIVISSWGPLKIYQRICDFDPQLAQRCIVLDLYLWENGMDYCAYYENMHSAIQQAYALLNDEKSRSVFSNLLQYKISRDFSLIEHIQDDVNLQYFDPDIISLGEEEIFLDLGAYTGDTVLSFKQQVNNHYKKIIALEPDKNNFVTLLRNTHDLHDIECDCLGIDSTSGTVHFNADSTWTSRVNEEGVEEIQTKSVDELLQGSKVTFIKADIEGLETRMLLGAEQTIRQYAPTLAIAAYHCKEDIFNLIRMIHEYNKEYKFYMRHYTEMPIDTVLYAVRENNI